MSSRPWLQRFVSGPSGVLCVGGTLACLVAAGCEREPAPVASSSPNIVLITIDTMRVNRVSPYFTTLDTILAPFLRISGPGGIVARSLEAAGYRPRYPTPNIDALARDGVVFDAAYCDVTWTTPSMASTMTGTYALRHGLRSNAHRLNESRVTLAEILAAHGYQTGAVIASYPLDSIYGLDQGFGVYDDAYTVPLFGRFAGEDADSDAGQPVRSASSIGMGLKTDAEVSDAATRLIASFAENDAPFFVWLHYFGPHSIQYEDLDNSENVRLHVATYSQKARRTDDAIGRVLRFLDESGLTDETLVILHSDHGESLGEHGYVGHGRFLYEDNLRVPLIMRWPSLLPSGKRVDKLVGNIDIAPTVLEAAGVDLSQSPMDGRSLLGAIWGDAPVRDDLYIETYMPAHESFAEPANEEASVKVGVRRYGVLGDGWKYLVTEPHPLFDRPDHVNSDEIARRFYRLELYGLEADPGEERNLADDEPDIASLYAQRLAEVLATADEGVGPDAFRPSAEHLEKLRALGYVD